MVTVIIIAFFVFSVEFIQDILDKYGDEMTENLNIWKTELGGIAYAIDVLIQEKSILYLVTAVFVITVAVCLLYTVYLMGFEHFLKTNLTFASFLIVGIGVVLLIFGIKYSKDINIGGDYTFIPYAVIGTGVVASILGIAGFICGLVPDKCLLAIFLLILVLIILTVAFFVFGLIVMYFPNLFHSTLSDVIYHACDENSNDKSFSLNSLSLSLSPSIIPIIFLVCSYQLLPRKY